MTIQAGYRYSGGKIIAGYWLGSAPALPKISSVSTLRHGLVLTITGTDFSSSGNEVYVNGRPAGVDTESDTTIVTPAFNAKYVPLTRPIEVYVVDADGNESNRVSVQCQVLPGERAFAVTASFLGSADYRCSANPDYEPGNEIKARSVIGSNATIDDVNIDRSGGIDVARNASHSVVSLEVDAWDGEEWSDEWAEVVFADITVDTASVPAVEGLSQAAATTLITAAGLVVSIQPDVFSNTVLTGLVASQFPPAGRVVAVGETVEIALSKGRAPITAPELRGLTPSAASSVMTASGLVLGSQRRYVDGLNTGLVIGQSIAAGTPLSAGTVIDVTVSSDRTPNVVGWPRLDAVNELADANLSVGQIGELHSATVPRDYVISQSPVADAPIGAQGVVSLVISLGVERTLPSTSGLRPAITLREFLLGQ